MINDTRNLTEGIFKQNIEDIGWPALNVHTKIGKLRNYLKIELFRSLMS